MSPGGSDPEQYPLEEGRTTEHARHARRFWLREARAQVRRARDLQPFIAPEAVTREALLGAFEFCLETARLYRHWARSVLA